MADITNQLQAAAGSAGAGPTGPTEYLAAAYGASPYFVLFSHNAGYITTAATYTLAAQSGAGLIDWSPDGYYIGVSQNNSTGFVLLNHTTPGTVSLAATYAIATSPRSISFSHDGDYIAVTRSASTLTLLNHTTPGTVSLAATYVLNEAARQASFPKTNSDYLAVGVADSPNFTLLNHTTPGSLSLATTYTIGTFSLTPDGTTFSPNGNYIAFARPNKGAGDSAQTYFTLFDHTTPGSVSVAATYDIPGASWNSWSPDNNYIAQGTTGGTFYLLNHTTPGSISVSATYTVTTGVLSTTFNPDGDYIALSRTNISGSTPTIVILNHTTPGSLSLASTYSLGGAFVNVRLSFCPVVI